MPRRTAGLALAVALAAAPAVVPTAAAAGSTTALVTTAPGTDPRQVLAGRGLEVDVLLGSVSRVTGPAAALEGVPGVVAVEAIGTRRPSAVPDDGRYDQQWSHQLTGIESAWDQTTGSADVIVAVLDTGVDGGHPDMGNLIGQYAFSGGERRTVPLGTDQDGCGGESDHGTHVAGIIGADGNDGVGVAGVNWRVSLLDLRVFDEECAGNDDDIIAAMGFAVEEGARVINMSLGAESDACSTAYATAIAEARRQGTLVVVASGNEEEEQPGITEVPGSCPGAVSVGAVDREGDIAPYSTNNQHVDVAAPGGNKSAGLEEGVLSSVPGDRHDWYEGTSMATPYVAGLAALMLSLDMTLSPDQLEAILEATSRDAGPDGRDDAYGWGVVDAAAAIDGVLDQFDPVLQPDPEFPVEETSADDEIPGPAPEEPLLDRIATGASTEAVAQAVASSRTTFDDGEAPYAVLARRDVFADALAGSSLTYGVAPLLFSGSTGPLPAATRTELERVVAEAGTVYLLGGPAALPSSLEAELRAMGYAPERLAGQTREATAVAVSVALDEVLAENDAEPATTYLLATAGNWPDAVTAGALGAYFGYPVLLTPPGALSSATRARLAEAQPERLLALGGTAVLSEAVVAAAARAAGGADAERLAGADRYGTAVAIAEQLSAELGAQDEEVGCVLLVNLVRADGWAHVLSSAPLAGAYGCVVLPAVGPAGGSLPAAVRDLARGSGLSGWVIGNTDVVAPRTADELVGLLRG